MKTRKKPKTISSIPRDVWMLWIDFTDLKLNKSKKILSLPDTKLKIDPAISRYFDKATEVNSKWKINILGSGDILEYYLTTGIEDKLNGDSIDWVIDFINNPNIGVQKKSDLIRIILLKYYGGVWIDASTFLITSLDWLDTLDSDFICPYVSVDQYVQFSLPPITHYSDKLKTADYDNWLRDYFFKTVQWGTLAKSAPFVPENWFLASIPHHPIIVDTVKMFEKVAKYIIRKSLNKTEIERVYAEYNMKLLYGKDKLFTLPNLSFKDPMMLNLFWEIGYLTEYTELYYALIKFMKKSSYSYKYSSKQLKGTLGKYGYTRRFFKSKCTIHNTRLEKGYKFNHCSDLIISNPTKGSVYLFSASFMRYFKWANTADERSLSEGSLFEKLMKSHKKKKDIIEYLLNNRQYFIKFGAWTRDSPLLDILFKRL
jgi:hypothetical protein